MNIATVLFTYNRPWHTQPVIDGLVKNKVLPEKLFIFHDGLKEGHDENNWREVREVISKVSFCLVEIIESDSNKGLAKSIIDGISYVLKDNDAVIVLEDDCVPAPNFMNFMYQVFHKYRNEKNVYNVSGYAWHVDLKSDKDDAYFNGRSSSWGWGTWKDRWLQYSQDNDILERIMSDKGKSVELASWGRDLPHMLFDRIRVKNNSWAVYFALKVIESNGLCICPYKTLIKNIGMDGSGVHCGLSEDYQDVLDMSHKEFFVLPNKKVISDCVYDKFKGEFGSYLVCKNQEKKGEDAVVYGMGDFFFQYENDIALKYHVLALCDRQRKGFYAGLEIIDISQIVDYVGSKVIIMIKNRQVASEVRDELQDKYGIDFKQIILGTDLFE